MNNQQKTFPELFLERLKIIYPKNAATIQTTLQEKPMPSFRTNTIKTTTPKLKASLLEQGFRLKDISWYSDAFILLNKSIRELTETEEYHQGQLYIQGLSSMIPALILDPQQNENILDLCAAPGSKTTQLAALMKNQGTILANDLSRQRLFKLKANLQLNGVTTTKTMNTVGEKLWQRYSEYFDKTLVDVPCSMEGRICLTDEKTYHDWSPKKIKLLANKQKYLLLSAISATKVGGTIVYSTCTLAPEENEGVIDWILKKIGDAIIIESIQIPHLSLHKGIAQWTKPFHSAVIQTSRTLPSQTMEGFFIAKIKKIRQTTPDHLPY
jgi:NOL1/NOP2/sun family putative RNA methylase